MYGTSTRNNAVIQRKDSSTGFAIDVKPKLSKPKPTFSTLLFFGVVYFTPVRRSLLNWQWVERCFVSTFGASHCKGEYQHSTRLSIS